MTLRIARFMDALNTLLGLGFMNPCPKILQPRQRGEYRKSFPNTKLLF
jgi:hypothetical protein